MTDLPTPERRAELRAMVAAKYAGGILLSEEIIALLDATEPVADAEVAQWVALFQGMFAGGEMWADKAAFLIARMARELAEARGTLAEMRACWSPPAPRDEFDEGNPRKDEGFT